MARQRVEIVCWIGASLGLRKPQES
jgi:hypothetical protein